MEYIRKEHDERTDSIIYEAAAGTCDFPEVFSLLSDFRKANDLEDCYVTVRKYEPEEIREDGKAAIEEAWEQQQREQGQAGKKGKRRPKTVPVDASKGHAWVTSFDWQVVEIADAKQIEYRFYDEGWPGHIVFSKSADPEYPTHIEAAFHISDKDLPSKFEALLASACRA